MFFEYAESIVELLANLIAVSICFFQFINRRSKYIVCATAIFLCGLLSSYYWTTYLLITGDTPVVSDWFYYSGWNTAYFILLILILLYKSKEELRYFHPLMLLPILPVTGQIILYLPYGGILNSVYEVLIFGVVLTMSIQSLCWYSKNKQNGVRFPYVALAAILLYITSSGMWVVTCFTGWVDNLYYPLSFLNSAVYIIIVWAVIRSEAGKVSPLSDQKNKKYRHTLKIAYAALVFVCCGGGLILGMWIKSIIEIGIENSSDSRVYDIITTVLFIISMFLSVSVVGIMTAVNLVGKMIENNEIREARIIADQSNRAKSEFLASMSHEIRTPINAIMGFNEIILRESSKAANDKPSDEDNKIFREISDHAGNIERAGENLLTIINDILDLSGIEAGKLKIVQAEYRLSSLLDDVSNMIGFKARAKALDFSVEVDDSIPDTLSGDEQRVKQIVINLLNNAVKYTDKGKIRLTVSCDEKAEFTKGQRIPLRFAVSDTGIGIRPEDMEKLFEKFERMDLARNSSVEGNGLGLAITKSLIAAMDGNIDVKSVYGEGSVFTAIIPQEILSCESIKEARSKAVPEKVRPEKAERPLYAPDAHILIVDDTPMNIKVATALLKPSKIHADTAPGGEEAIEMAKSVKYDVILMDQMMPKVDGTTALHRIREQEDGANRETPVICLTADAVNSEKYIEAGFTDYLAKPIVGDSLETILKKYLPADLIGDPET
ncbi:MAG: response regulator [Lachnospiraceae bacterium]|nr:response regulator [Lachnospiraceae bacterium]